MNDIQTPKGHQKQKSSRDTGHVSETVGEVNASPGHEGLKPFEPKGQRYGQTCETTRQRPTFGGQDDEQAAATNVIDFVREALRDRRFGEGKIRKKRKPGQESGREEKADPNQLDTFGR
jgi:hypothetical protein